MPPGRHIAEQKEKRGGEAVRAVEKQEGAGRRRRVASRTVSIAERGNAIGAIRAMVRTIMRPNVHKRRTVRVKSPPINEYRRRPRINLIPQSPWNPLSRPNHQTWKVKGARPASANAPVRRPWKWAANFFANMMTVSRCWIRAGPPTRCASNGWKIVICARRRGGPQR